MLYILGIICAYGPVRMHYYYLCFADEEIEVWRLQITVKYQDSNPGLPNTKAHDFNLGSILSLPGNSQTRSQIIFRLHASSRMVVSNRVLLICVRLNANTVCFKSGLPCTV